MTESRVRAMLELAEQCEKADGPSYDLDCDIWDAIYPGERDARFEKLSEGPYKGRLSPADRDGYIKPLRSFTSSLDAAMTLVPERTEWAVGSGPIFATSARVGGNAAVKAATPALALCAAALRARASNA